MAKYHIGRKGSISICLAGNGNCPLGKHNPHFEDKETAEKYVEKILSKKHPKIQTISRRQKKNLTMNLTENTMKVINLLKENGVQPMIVGGSVRDAYMKGEYKDIDIELYGSKNGESSTERDIARILSKNKDFRVSEVGKSFGVVKVYCGSEDYDLSLPRREESTGIGHKEYDLVSDSRLDYREAAQRRDYTMNAISFDPINNKIIDPYNGYEDLKNNILKHVSHDFSDDPLRVLRGMNFISRFGSTVHPETMELCRSLAKHCSSIPKERIVEEFNKTLFKGNDIGKAFGFLYDSGWNKELKGFDESRERLFEVGVSSS